MRIPFSWRLERERKISSKGQRHSAPLCSEVQASFGPCLKHCFAPRRSPRSPRFGDPAMTVRCSAGQEWPW